MGIPRRHWAIWAIWAAAGFLLLLAAPPAPDSADGGPVAARTARGAVPPTEEPRPAPRPADGR